MYTLNYLIFSLIAINLLVLMILKNYLHRPKDHISYLLLVNYLILLPLVFTMGQYTLTTMFLLTLALMIRIILFMSVRSYNLANSEIWFSKHIHQYFVCIWLDLAAFTLSLPLGLFEQLMLIILSGLLCGWRVKIIQNNYLSHLEGGQSYLETVAQYLLNIVFPANAKIIDNHGVSLDTFAFYAGMAAWIGFYIAVSYGFSLSFVALVLIAAFLGAYLMWYLTCVHKISNMGFSFFGGFLASLASISIYLYLNNNFTISAFNCLVIALAVGHAIGRIGCIGHGCCTGKVHAEAQHYDIIYSDPKQKINRIQQQNIISCSPTVLIEALGQIAICLACLSWPQSATATWLIAYGILRIIIQGLRLESGDFVRIFISSSLIVSGVLVAVSFQTDLVPPTFDVSNDKMWLITLLAIIYAACLGLRIKSYAKDPVSCRP